MIQKDGTLDPAKPQKEEVNDSESAVQDVATTTTTTVVPPSTIVKASELEGYVFRASFSKGTFSEPRSG